MRKTLEAYMMFEFYQVEVHFAVWRFGKFRRRMAVATARADAFRRAKQMALLNAVTMAWRKTAAERGAMRKNIVEMRLRHQTRVSLRKPVGAGHVLAWLLFCGNEQAERATQEY